MYSVNWFDNVMIDHNMSLKVTMFFETFLVIIGDLSCARSLLRPFKINSLPGRSGVDDIIMNFHDMSPTISERCEMSY